LFITVVVLLLTNTFFVACGYFALGIEAFMGLPRLVQNAEGKSARGMSFYMVLGWAIADALKIWYFVAKMEPVQFLYCGYISLIIDIVVLVQIQWYRKDDKTVVI
jgi:Na+-translocating ferredoxin:NAD+ oxidoreductase RnfA subunit